MSEQRWQKVNEFITEWFGPLGDAAGYSEEEITEAEARLGMRLPEALREWYGLWGKWYSELQEQNRLYPLEKLELVELDIEEAKHKTLVFHEENQGVCEWAIRLEDFEKEDPPVYDEVNQVLYSPRLTEFLLTGLIFETSCVDTANVCYGKADDSVLALLETHLQCWHASESMGNYFGNGEALVMLWPAREGLVNEWTYGDAPGKWFVDLHLRSEDKTEHYRNLLASEVRWK